MHNRQGHNRIQRRKQHRIPPRRQWLTFGHHPTRSNHQLRRSKATSIYYTMPTPSPQPTAQHTAMPAQHVPPKDIQGTHDNVTMLIRQRFTIHTTYKAGMKQPKLVWHVHNIAPLEGHIVKACRLKPIRHLMDGDIRKVHSPRWNLAASALTQRIFLPLLSVENHYKGRTIYS